MRVSLPNPGASRWRYVTRLRRWETDGQHKYVAQWFDVAGHHLGPWAKWLAVVIMLINLTGAAVVQTVASANSIYTVNQNFNK